MKSTHLEESNSSFLPTTLKETNDLANHPFIPRHIVFCFEGWEFLDAHARYIDASEERNIVWFEQAVYYINGKEFKYPATLKEFMEDCQSLQIHLSWNDSSLSQLYDPN